MAVGFGTISCSQVTLLIYNVPGTPYDALHCAKIRKALQSPVPLFQKPNANAGCNIDNKS